jgi:hypothetical protein
MRIARGRIVLELFLNTFFRLSTRTQVKGFAKAAAPDFSIDRNQNAKKSTRKKSLLAA